jgi:hypothetical protein
MATNIVVTNVGLAKKMKAYKKMIQTYNGVLLNSDPVPQRLNEPDH